MRLVSMQLDDESRDGRHISIEPITVRIPVAIQMSGIGRSKLYELIKAGEIETVKIGSCTLIPVASLRRLLAPRDC